MRISDWSSDVCSSDLCQAILKFADDKGRPMPLPAYDQCMKASHAFNLLDARGVISVTERQAYIGRVRALAKACCEAWVRSEEHTSELQSLMRISYAVFCLKKKKDNTTTNYIIPYPYN